MIVKPTGAKYLTLRELYNLNSNVNSIFDMVKSIFDTPISESHTLFNIFMFKYGDCHVDRILFNVDNFGQQDIIEMMYEIYYFYLENKYKFDTLIQSEKFEYNPIENYNMSEHTENTRTPDLEHETTYNTTDTRTPNLTDSTESEYIPRVKYKTETDNTDTEKVSAYDTNNFANNKQNILDGENTVTPILGTNNKGDETSETTTHTGTDTNKKTGSDTTTDTGSETFEQDLTRSGNIGVTTSQQMIQSEREIADFSALTVFMRGVADRIFLIY